MLFRSDFEIHFDNLYDETDQEREELIAKRTETLIRQREYPELESAFKQLKLLDEDVSFAGMVEPETPPDDETGGTDDKKPKASTLTRPLA